MTENATIARFSSNNYHEELFKNFKVNDFTDITLWAGGKSVPAHRCVLAAASSVFHEMLKSCNNDGCMSVLVLNDISYEHLCSLIEYMYWGKTKIARSQLNEFFLMAKKFNVLGLSELPSMNNYPFEVSVSRVRHSMTHEDDIIIDASDVDEHTQTAGGSGQRGTKRKTKENDNESPSGSGETSRKSKRGHTRPQKMTNENDKEQQQPSNIGNNAPANDSSSMEKHATVLKGAMPNFNMEDIQNAMNAVNATDCKHQTVISVAKKLGYDITKNKKALQSLSGKMSHLLKH